MKSQLNKSKRSFYNIIYEYEYVNFWVYYNIGIIEKDDELLFTGFNVDFSKVSKIDENQFSFEDKGVINYIFISLLVLVPLFISVSLIFLFTTQISRKWLWFIFILFGFGAINLNWNSGTLDYQIITIKLLGAGYYKPLVLLNPWFVSILLPVGAITFWIIRYNFAFKEEEGDFEESDLNEK